MRPVSLPCLYPISASISQGEPSGQSQSHYSAAALPKPASTSGTQRHRPIKPKAPLSSAPLWNFLKLTPRLHLQFKPSLRLSRLPLCRATPSVLRSSFQQRIPVQTSLRPFSSTPIPRFSQSTHKMAGGKVIEIKRYVYPQQQQQQTPCCSETTHTSKTYTLTHPTARPSGTRRSSTPPSPSSSTSSPPGAVLARPSPLKSRSSARPTRASSSTRLTLTSFKKSLPTTASPPCPLSSSSRTVRSLRPFVVPTPPASRLVWPSCSHKC